MIYGYIRVSTDHQTVENQRFEIENFCKINNLKINHWIQETISSQKQLTDRKLGKLLEKLEAGDVLITSELSRLGRNLLQVMGILQLCLEKECQIWTIKENYRLGADITSKVLAFAFALSAEIERQLISQRTKESLHRLRAQGKHLGRPFGSASTLQRLQENKNIILKLTQENLSKSEIARRFRVNRGTLNRFIKNNSVSFNPEQT